MSFVRQLPKEVRSELERLSIPQPWRCVLAGALDWAIVMVAVGLAIYADHWISTALAWLTVASRQHALLVLTHEGAHYHVHKNRKINDLISNLCFAYPILFDTNGYRESHLMHHRYLNTDLDPDWVRKRDRPDWQFPVKWHALALFVPYFFLLKGPIEWLLTGWHFSGLGYRAHWQTPNLRTTMLLKIGYASATIGALYSAGLLPLILFYWFIPLFFIFPALQRMRSIAEHYGLEYTSELTSTRDVVVHTMDAILFGPHNVGLHLTHHLWPAIPFSNLNKAHDLLKTRAFHGQAHINSSYLVPFEGSVLKDLVTNHKKPNAADTAA